MDSLERYLGDTYELVDTLKNSDKSFVVAVYDKRARRLCMMKRRELKCLSIYRMLKELNDPHIPQIYRLFERNGKLIVVEEHIDGQTLEDFFIYQQLNETLAEEILLQLCECLAILHKRNIIHRDLKPSNIMLTEKNFVKLIDFGIARIFKPENAADTELIGTRGYAPPEQFGLFEFGQTDSRTDIYSLGITMKTLLGENYGGNLKKILDKCTALEPGRRFQSAEELRDAILRRKKFRLAQKFFVASTIGLAIIFFPKTAEFDTPPEEIPVPAQIDEKIPVPVEKSEPPKKLFDEASIKIPMSSLPEINLPMTAPVTLPEINKPPAQVEENSSGEVELKLFLNGEPTSKEHMIYLSGWQNWARDKYGQFLFPDDWNARLHIENHSGKNLINPSIEVNIGEYEKNIDVPALANGQSFDLEIPLGNKLASPEKGSGHLQIIFKAEGVSKIFLNKTFFLAK